MLILVPVLGLNFSLVESDCAALESGFPSVNSRKEGKEMELKLLVRCTE